MEHAVVPEGLQRPVTHAMAGGQSLSPVHVTARGPVGSITQKNGWVQQASNGQLQPVHAVQVPVQPPPETPVVESSQTQEWSCPAALYW
jgi:hypothetical protein